MNLALSRPVTLHKPVEPPLEEWQMELERSVEVHAEGNGISRGHRTADAGDGRWPAAGTRPPHLRCQNSKSAECGIFVYDGRMMYLTRSHKAKRSTNREFYVARFLPVQPGHLLFKYLVYIRPVVDMLMREQRPDLRACSTYLFRAQVSDDSKPWATERLTNVIIRFTARAWRKGITLQILRQLSVGLSEKHVREVVKPFNRFDDRTDAADRNVSFAWQTGHPPVAEPVARVPAPP
ncbi:hypothetical protein N657DRAFT_490811 [Parathielavia appendiculata]|uniref:Uncharacterized protein n=1 Tax=Parathielavia appendiculata TaxID=2587402 RepID=A0AAN6YY25_9PEZI|nr:hypothetical protein N657DRAFT_490811 [Parathielavia appendiculata]